MSKNIFPVFSSFCYKKNFNNKVLDRSLFEKTAYDCERQSEGLQISNMGGYHSPNFLRFDDDPMRSKLLDVINKELKKCAIEFGLKLEGKKIKVSNFWFNINRKKDHNKMHTHSGSIFSGVFYIKTPDRCGRLVLEDPSAQLMQSFLKYWHLEVEWNQYTSMVWSVSPDPGDLVIFPSWMSHYVEPNMSDEDRISISFNTVVENEQTTP